VARLEAGATQAVIVRAAELGALSGALERAGADIERNDGWLRVRGLEAAEVGEAALAQGVALHALYEERASLEDVFLRLTAGEAEAAVR
jgi:ABC-2 type transport system ATP-binding protein